MKLGKDGTKLPKARIVTGAILMTGLLFVAVALLQSKGQKKAEEILREIAKKPAHIKTTETISEDTVSRNGLSDNNAKDDEEAMVIDFDALLEVNGDIKAWITVPNTRIDYPVLCATEREGADYYLKRNYKREDDDHGSLYIETGEDENLNDRCVIIYGHNMRDGSMLGTLYGLLRLPKLYSNKIYVYTPDGRKREGELMACYETDAENLREKYHGLSDVQDIWEYTKTFDNRTDNCVALEEEVIDRKRNLLTLSTCSSGGKGRVLAQYAVKEISQDPE